VATRLLSAIAALALGLGSGSHSSGGAVVIEKRGFGHASGGVGRPYSFGIVLVNRSATLDAVGVTVDVTVLGPRSFGAFYGRDFQIAVIPAGSRFVVGDGGEDFGVRITGITATVRVRAMRPKRSELAQVSSVRIDRRRSEVTAVMTNPFAGAINLYDASAYAVVLDRAGRVVGGGSSAPLAAALGGPATVALGGRLPFAVSVAGAPMARVARAEVSVNP
jgi:hypothetical protein